MPLQRTENYTTIGTKPSWNADPSIAPFNLNVAVSLIGAATGTFSLQYTYDVFDSPTMLDSDADWVTSTVIPLATAADIAQAFTAPITRFRLVIATITGTIRMTALQGFSVN